MKTPIHDYYALLGVPKSASLTQIKQSYRKLAIIHHPDRAGDGRQIVLINEAYATLKDPKKRAEYDIHHALYFSKAGKLSHLLAQRVHHNLKRSPVVMAKLKALERHAIALARFADDELRPTLTRHSKKLFDKLSTLMSHPPVMPMLTITLNIAMYGGQVAFVHEGRTIRTTLPCGLTDGSQIKLTIDGVGVWFVIKINNI